jgi:hypothetical protein
MSKARRDYDVFLSYALTDRPTAEKVTQAMQNAGLSVFRYIDLPAGGSVPEEIRRALAISDALVLILPSEGALDANTGIELGAAMAWSKPICVVRPENGHVRIPAYLSEYPSYPVSRIDDVVNAVRKGQKPLSAEKVEALKATYVSMGIPTDRFVSDPTLLDELARQFASRAGSSVSGVRLLNEMMKLRKKGEWPRLQAGRKATT